MKFRRNSDRSTGECGVKDSRGDRCALERGHDPQVGWTEREHRCADGATFTFTSTQSPGRSDVSAMFLDFTPPHTPPQM